VGLYLVICHLRRRVAVYSAAQWPLYHQHVRSVARLTGTYLDNSANSVLDSSVYGYNSGNQRAAFTNAAGTYVQYAYDPIVQLKVAASSVNTEDRGYFYDAAWNLNRLTNTRGK
jgi:hypothetical protein